MSDKMENNWIWVAVGAAALLGAAYYFTNKKEDGVEEPLPQVEEMDKLTLAYLSDYFTQAEEMDKLTLAYVSDYFKKSYKAVVKVHPNVIPIVLKVKGDIFGNNDADSLFFALTYYNKDTNGILEDNTKNIKTKSIDVNLKDAFGDKDMLVLS